MSVIAWFFLGCACGSFACFIGSIVLILAFPRETAEVVVERFAPDKMEPCGPPPLTPEQEMRERVERAFRS